MLELTSFQLEDEAPLVFKRLIAMDGNNSLKRMRRNGLTDTRTFDDSDIYLPSDYVNLYANEVKSRTPPQQPTAPSAVADPAPVADNNSTAEEGDPADGQEDPSPCADRWKAAAAEHKKRTWDVFEETGIFASACQHSMILWVADMVESGEL